MKGKQILDATFGYTFPKKNYLAFAMQLDRESGAVGSPKNLIAITVELCRVIDEMEVELADLKEKYANLSRSHADKPVQSSH